MRRTLTLVRSGTLTSLDSTTVADVIGQIPAARWDRLPSDVRDAFQFLADFVKADDPRRRRAEIPATVEPPPVFVVHFLRCGFTLCGMPGLPKDWPDDHRFVSLEMDLPRITCARCRTEAERPRRRRR